MRLTIATPMLTASWAIRSDRGLAGVVDNRRITPFSRYFTRRPGSVLTPRTASVMTTIDGAKISIQRRPPRSGSGSVPNRQPDDDEDERRQQDRQEPDAWLAEEQLGLDGHGLGQHRRSPC